MVIVEPLILADVVVTVHNVLFSPSYSDCYSGFAALPGANSGGCGYDGFQTVGYMVGVVVVLALVVWSWWLVAGWLLRPLTATAQTVRLFGPHNLGQRIRLSSGPDRYKDLADAIDDALDRRAH